jgi:geranylgeranyl pyrophosphate synthase
MCLRVFSGPLHPDTSAGRLQAASVSVYVQVTDDVLDFTGKSQFLGKPAMNDIKSGVVTAPVLYAAEEFPELVPLIMRKFREPSDVERAIEFVGRSQGIERSKALAKVYVDAALDSLERFGSEAGQHSGLARVALQQLCLNILEREK